MSKTLGDRLYSYCLNHLDFDAGILILKVDGESLITTHFNPAAAKIWQIPAPKKDNIARWVLGKPYQDLLAKSEQLGQSDQVLKALVKNAVHVGQKIEGSELGHKNPTLDLKIGAWNNEEPVVAASFGAFTSAGETCLLGIMAQSKENNELSTQVIKVAKAIANPENWATVRETLEAQSEEADKLGPVIAKWVLSLSALTAVSLGAVASIPGISNLWPKPTEASDLAEDSKPLREALESMFSGVPGPPGNGVFYFRYSPDCRVRTLLATHSPTLKQSSFDVIKSRFTSERGWADILAAHKQGEPYILLKSKYEEDHPLYKLMEFFGVNEVVTVPVLSNSECPLGYLSIGYGRNLSQDEQRDIISYLNSAIAQYADNFPRDRGAAIIAPPKVPQPKYDGENKSDQFSCTEINGTHVCSLRGRSQPLVPPQ